MIGFTAAACAENQSVSPEILAPAPETSASISEAHVYDGKSFINTLELPKGPYPMFALPKLTSFVREKHAQNSDTVAWIKVPGTTIDDVVVCYPGDRNSFYLRRNFDKRSDFNGSIFADYRTTFDKLKPNTTIYGHSMSDDPLDYRKQFSPLKLFQDIEFAKKTPYVYLSTAGEDLVFEVFTVMFTGIDLYYIDPDPKDFEGLIEKCRARSLYNYDVSVKKGDKILTLSTCTYSLPDGRTFPVNTDEHGYRYAVMAKLVADKTNLKNKASLTVNNSIAAI